MQSANRGKADEAVSLWRSLAQVRTLLYALAAGILISICGFLVDRLVHRADRLLASDFYTCGIAFVFTYVLLQLESRRRAVLARRMEIVAEVNHHIRNALTGVVFTAAARNDPAMQAVLEDATARIDWVLTTVLPDGSAELQWPVQSKTWHPSPWKGAASGKKITEAAPLPLRAESDQRPVC